jgi:hypothetical protein
MSKAQQQLQNRIERLQEQLQQVKAQQRDMEARRKLQERKDETRAKIILGGLALKNAQICPDSEFTATMVSLVNGYVMTKKEHALVTKYLDRAIGKK